MSHPARRLPVVACLVSALLGPGPARAQGSWDATLIVAPFPSPYLSDWETNPTIATYTLINGTDREQEVVLHYEVRNQAGVVVTSGRSDPQPIAPGVPAVYTSFTDIAGSTQHDATLEDQVTRSGRMPEGDYTACVVAVSRSGFVLARACETFTVVYPDPPMLIGPADGDLVSAAAPIFQWTPLQVPADFSLRFVIQVAEVRPDQTPYTALTANILHYENVDVGATSLVYPVDGLPLTSGATYAWRVVAMDQNGYAAATNGGSSEIWTFRYDDGLGLPEGTRSSVVTLSLARDPTNLRGSAPPDDGTNGLSEICTEWDAPGGSATREPRVSIGGLPWLMFPRALDTPASLVRRELGDGSRIWALIGKRDWEVPAVLVYGDCDALGQGTVVRWIGVRRIGGTQELDAWLKGEPIDSIEPDSSRAFPALEFGVGIFTLYEMTATGDSLEPVEVFLEGHSVDVRPGFNVYGILNGGRLGILDWVAEALHTTTDDFEVQGFLGMDNTLSAGVSFGGGEDAGLGGDLSLQQSFFVLRGALPAWERPFGSQAIKSLQLGIQVELNDSLSLGLGSSAADSGDVFKKTDVDIVLTATVTVVTANDVTWEGAIGRDWNVATGEAKWLVKLGSDRRWQPGPLAGTRFYLGNLGAEFDAEKLTDLFTEGTGWSLGIGGSLDWGDASIASFGITFGRKDLATTWSQLVAKDTALIKADEALIEDSREQLRRAEERGDEAAAAAYRQQIADREARLARTQRSLRADLLALEQQERAKKEGRQKPNPTNTPKTPGMWWRARLALGTMGIMDLIDLVRSAAAGGTP